MIKLTPLSRQGNHHTIKKKENKKWIATTTSTLRRWQTKAAGDNFANTSSDRRVKWHFGHEVRFGVWRKFENRYDMKENKGNPSGRQVSTSHRPHATRHLSIYTSIYLSISGSSHYSHGPQFMSNCDVWGQLWPASTIMTHTNVSNCQTFDKRTHKSRWGRQGLWAKGQRLWCEPHNIPADNVMKWRPAWILI